MKNILKVLMMAFLTGSLFAAQDPAKLQGASSVEKRREMVEREIYKNYRWRDVGQGKNLERLSCPYRCCKSDDAWPSAYNDWLGKFDGPIGTSDFYQATNDFCKKWKIMPPVSIAATLLKKYKNDPALIKYIKQNPQEFGPDSELIIPDKQAVEAFVKQNRVTTIAERVCHAYGLVPGLGLVNWHIGFLGASDDEESDEWNVDFDKWFANVNQKSTRAFCEKYDLPVVSLAKVLRATPEQIAESTHFFNE